MERFLCGFSIRGTESPYHGFCSRATVLTPLIRSRAVPVLAKSLFSVTNVAKGKRHYGEQRRIQAFLLLAPGVYARRRSRT